MFSDDCLADMEMRKQRDVLAERFTGVDGQGLGSSHHIEGRECVACSALLRNLALRQPSCRNLLYLPRSRALMRIALRERYGTVFALNSCSQILDCRTIDW